VRPIRWLPATASELLAVVLLVLSWIVVAAGVFLGQGDVESLLLRIAPPSHPDAFDGINSIVYVFFGLHTVLSFVGWMAVTNRRKDVLLVLLVGPALTIALNGATQDWSDPAWFTIVAVSGIGWLVGIVVATTNWLVRSQ